MSDERPRPQYGEYATPEQQASAAGLPYQPPAPDAAARVNVAPPSSETPVSPAVQARSAYPGDRLGTLFLLGIGVFTLLQSLPEYLSYSTALNSINKQLGIGAFPLVSLADKVGIALLVVHVVIFLLTVWWALRTLARGKRAFYIPLVGFAVFAVIYSVVITLLIHADPTFWAQFSARFS
jgi:hypothetical protein